MKYFKDSMAGGLLARATMATALPRGPVECNTDQLLALPKVWRAIMILRRKNYSVDLIAVCVERVLNESLSRRGSKPTKLSPKGLRRALQRQARIRKDADACRWLNVKLPTNASFTKAPQPRITIPIPK